MEAELQESFAVRHLPRLDWGRVERAGCPHTKGTAYLTGTWQRAAIYDNNKTASCQGQCPSAVGPTVVLHISITDGLSAYKVNLKNLCLFF